ncbi:hypothetical protein [Endomicrobium proavitum]|uniref:Uncharacterized protein n=1 Tax=Endomicrobium proavitum TaxID=1408281 RepID=A0A0G3WLZ8_9BACT|nr:hypothetical protein [Endomicrobium proavitum]AKL98479.1 hypothetical protein Epro_1100 [Endomicrobium proavitum]
MDKKPVKRQKSRKSTHRTKKSKSKVLEIIVIIAIVIVGIKIISFPVGCINAMFEHKLKIERKANSADLSAMVKEINLGLPVMVDDLTRIDSVSLLPSNTLKYSVTIIDYAKDELNIKTFKELKTKSLTAHFKEEPAKGYVKFIKNNNISLVYQYNDKNGEELFTVDIPAAQTGK